ncbi:PCI domain-containing protein [Hyaloraphidium curvatum]|nr:PCI domain-containing protein [Hyaloraphidium curvatum]
MTDAPKQEKDFTKEVDEELPKAVALAQAGRLHDALESLLVLEKQTRTSADVASNGRVLVQIISLCHDAKDWKLLNEHLVLLSKKHGLLKGAVSKMVQEAISFVDKAEDMSTKLELIETLRTITEGKIYVEVERARLTRTLAKIKEDEGKIDEAAEILQDLQVETFGSMERREKTDFILEQMRICLLKKDYVRMQIISRKISTRFFEQPENEDLKLRFYDLMIQYALHEKSYIDVCKYYRQIYDSKSVKDDPAKMAETLRNIVLFVILSPYDNEQSDLIARVSEDPNLSKIALYKELLKNFTTRELMRWSKVEEIYGPDLKSSFVFDLKTDEGRERLKELHKRVIEHNIRVIAQYYTKISLKRMTQLLDLNEAETEEYLSKLVVSKTIWARIDRPTGIVNFEQKRDPNTMLNDWSNDVKGVLELIAKSTHYIVKEEMQVSLALAKAVES